MHPRIILAVLALGFSSIAPAQVFRCTDAAGSVGYQSQPCPTEGGPVELTVHEPTAQDRAQAATRFDSQQRLVREYEADHERGRLAAERERARISEARAALDARCARYAEEIARREKSDKAGRRNTPTQAERIRDAQARYFSECFGRR